ncbi:chemotaxis protein CheB [Undibacterium sp. Di27W]|uniref:chemotaxis protein CheB n=1 Tax=Undibacterium sp. Di27W TaxID=3413036 RepID=UPI003BF17CD4
MKHTSHPAVDIVVIGASTGGVEALRVVVAGLPLRFSAAVIVVMHIGTHESILPSLLARTCVLPVRHAQHGELVEAGRVLVAPPDFHLTLLRQGAECRVVLARTAKENYTRPAIDPLFRSAAATYGRRAIGVILTGSLDDGSAGLAAIKACGGSAIVQNPDEALAPDMPASAIENVAVDRILKLEEIPQALIQLVEVNVKGDGTIPQFDDVPHWVKLENKFAVEGVEIDGLKLLAKPSTFTCPECNGTLWELNDQRPRRFRCHTGHAYTQRSLMEFQNEMVENAVWFAMRSLQEKHMLLSSMAKDALLKNLDAVAAKYDTAAIKAQQNAETLRTLIAQLPDE